MTTVTLRSGEVRESGYEKHPTYRVHTESSPRRVRVELGGSTLVDTTRAVLLHETRHTPVYYFPLDDINWEALTPTEHSTFCPFKGEAYYWSADVNGVHVENCVWSYPHPLPQVPELKDYVGLYWNKMDKWFEEDEEVFVHPRDPYVRIDVLESRREVVVEWNGQELARSKNARFLFETGLPTRYYIPAEDVRMDLLSSSDTVTQCPYKGTAQHLNATAGGTVAEDVAWVYPEPLAEVAKIRDLICFYDERVERISIDGNPIEKPRTKWSH